MWWRVWRVMWWRLPIGALWNYFVGLKITFHPSLFFSFLDMPTRRKVLSKRCLKSGGKRLRTRVQRRASSLSMRRSRTNDVRAQRQKSTRLYSTLRGRRQGGGMINADENNIEKYIDNKTEVIYNDTGRKAARIHRDRDPDSVMVIIDNLGRDNDDVLVRVKVISQGSTWTDSNVTNVTYVSYLEDR